MITSTGVQLYRWFHQGIEDFEDLQWLLEFYQRETYPLSIIGYVLTEARRYLER